MEEKEVKDENVVKVDLKKKPDETVHKVDLTKKEEEDAVQEQSTDEVPVRDESETSEEVREEDEQPAIEEITDQAEEEKEEEVEEVVEEVVAEKKPNVELPENIEKLVEFINETGGTVEDYVMLNKDFSEMDNLTALEEYYKVTKPHLSAEERSFLMEETFSYNEDVDDAKEIKRKKIALKEQVAEAKAYLDGQKSKYYEEIKAGSKLTTEQQEAINFYNKYNKDQESQKKLSEKSKRTFLNKTDSFFGQDFKGFEYNVGDKKYRFNVKDVDKVKTTQSDINNFINKFVGEDKTTIDDAAGYHKSLYTAMNADAIAKHFYEQGKADAIKGQIAKDKNINLEPRKTHGETNVGGVKYRVLGQSSSDIKNRSFKIRKRN